MAKEDKTRNISKEEAIESLKSDFGEEGFEVLMNGVDAIVDVTNKFNMPYKAFQEKVEEAAKKGLIKKTDDMVYGFELREEAEEEQENPDKGK